MTRFATASDANVQNATAREMSENDLQIVSKAFAALHSVLGNYFIGEKDLGPINLHSEKQCASVAVRAVHALETVRKKEKQAYYASVKGGTDAVIAPFLAAAQAMRSSFDSLPPAMLDLLKSQGAKIPDSCHVPVAMFLPLFPAGTTIETARSVLHDMSFNVASTRGRNATWEVIVPLVAHEGPKNVATMVRENREAVQNAAE